MKTHQSNGNYELFKSVHEWDKNDRGEKTRLNIAKTSSGDYYVDLRHWYIDKTDLQLKPGKGIAILIEDDNMDNLEAAFKALFEAWEDGSLLAKE